MHVLKNKPDLLFYAVCFLITVFFVLLFKPVSDIGDGPSYLSFAQNIFENGNTDTFISRSPFYPWILSLLIYIFGTSTAVNLMIMLQYFLVYFAVILVYRLLVDIYDNRNLAKFVAIIVMINFSCIFYSYMLLTETMTLFFLVLLTWLLINGINKSMLINFFLSGVTLSVMILTRFNTLPMVFVFLVIVFILEFGWKKVNRGIAFRDMFFFLIPVIIILNGYAFLNYQKHGFYGLFPSGGSLLVSRNTLIATIDGSEKVSEENKAILEIFVSAGGKNAEYRLPERKGSLIRFDRFKIAERLYKGFPVYSTAVPELCKYFHIDPAKPEPDLSRKLAAFYTEIRKLNKREVLYIRALSLLSSFRSSSSLEIPGNPDLNLGKLPAWMIIGYKLIFFTFSVFVFIASIIYLIRYILKVIKPNMIILFFILVIIGFFFINFAFATAADANRFKYPGEPMIIALGVYFLYNIFLSMKGRMKLI